MESPDCLLGFLDEVDIGKREFLIAKMAWGTAQYGEVLNTSRASTQIINYLEITIKKYIPLPPLSTKIGQVGVEPTRYYYRRILSPLRLPFRHCPKRSIILPFIHTL